MADLIESVEEARLARGMTQAQLATSLGMSQPHYSKIANGSAKLTDEVAHRMQSWIEGGEAPPSHEIGRQVRELTRSIQRQTRELAKLLRGQHGVGTGRAIRRVARKAGAHNG